jgi:hypothetical protein
MPITSPTRRDNIVTWPCPCGAAPVVTTARPFASIRIATLSNGEVAVASM